MNAVTQNKLPRPLSIQAGVGLIEVLIAALVLSIGLLGLAGLQMKALKNNQSSLERSLSIVESYSIVDAMRVDRNSARNGIYNIGLEDTPSGNSFAGKELTKWRNRLTESLGPDATGAINCDASDCTITVQWNDERGIEGEEALQIVTEVRL